MAIFPYIQQLKISSLNYTGSSFLWQPRNLWNLFWNTLQRQQLTQEQTHSQMNLIKFDISVSQS